MSDSNTNTLNTAIITQIGNLMDDSFLVLSRSQNHKCRDMAVRIFGNNYWAWTRLACLMPAFFQMRLMKPQQPTHLLNLWPRSY